MSYRNYTDDDLCCTAEEAANHIANHNYDCALWRLVDVAGELARRSPESMGAKFFTGAGFRIEDSGIDTP